MTAAVEFKRGQLRMKLWMLLPVGPFPSLLCCNNRLQLALLVAYFLSFLSARQTIICYRGFSGFPLIPSNWPVATGQSLTTGQLQCRMPNQRSNALILAYSLQPHSWRPDCAARQVIVGGVCSEVWLDFIKFLKLFYLFRVMFHFTQIWFKCLRKYNPKFE